MRKLALVGVIALAGCGHQAPKLIPEPTTSPEVAPTTTELTTSTTEVVETTTIAETTTTLAELRKQTTTSAIPITIPVRSSELASIRACESGGDYTTNTGNGFYGAYQFTLSTWASVGGSGNPAYASVSEQDMRAQMMIDAGRRGEWPNC